MIWNESIECMDRESLRKIQGIRLKKTVERVYHDTPFYRRKMQELGITPDDINSIDDIVKLPFTTKYDLRDNYPFGLCAVPMSQIVRIHASSGTTGKPTVVGYTRKTCRYGRNASRVLLRHTVRAARTFSRYPTDTDFYRRTGCACRCREYRRIRHSDVQRQYGETDYTDARFRFDGALLHALLCVVSGGCIKDFRFPREEFKLKFGAFGAEPWTENMRRDIEAKLGIKAYDIYGLSEIAGPGVGYECECQQWDASQTKTIISPK